MTTTKVEADPKFKAFIKRLEESARTEVFVGVLGPNAAASHDAVTNVDVATWNEFGVEIDGEEHVPERSFLRATIDIKNAEITKRLGAELGKAYAGKQSTHNAFDRTGLAVVGMVQQRIADGIPPGNADATIEKKGSNKPLIDTGQLRSSISHQVK